VNGTVRPGTLPPQLFDPIDYRNNLQHLGSFSGRKIICKKITTNQTELSDIEPILTFDSKTAINFYTDISSNAGSMGIGSTIYFGNDASSGTDISLDNLIRSQRRVGLEIAANFTPGLDIIMDLSSITETPSTRTPYDIMFNIYEHVNVSVHIYPELLYNYMAIPSGSANTFELMNVSLPKPDSEVLAYNDYTFTNLEPGKFYTVIARITNLVSDSVSYIFVEPQNIPTIKHVEIIEIVVVTEYSIRISFRGHHTQVSDWRPASNLLVYFHTGIGPNVDDDLLNDILTSAPPSVTQNLSLPIPLASSSMSILYLNTTLDYLIPTTLNGPVCSTNPMEVDVISKHDDLPTSTFIMRKSEYLTPYSFDAPSAPTLTLHSSGPNIFTWTTSTNTRIRDIFYNIYREVTAAAAEPTEPPLNTNELLNILRTNDRTNVNRNTIYTVPNVCYSGIHPGYYKIRAFNTFNLLGLFSNRVQITDITVTTPVISFHVGAQLKVSYTVSNFNRSFTIASDQTITATPSNSLFYTNVKTAGVHTTYVEVTDAFGLKIRSTTSNILTVHQATITATGLTYISFPRIYECTVRVDGSQSYNSLTLGGISSSSRSEMDYHVTNIATGNIQFTLNDTGTSVVSVTGRANITGTDVYGFITNTVSTTSLVIHRPNITIGPFTYANIARTFEATITSSSDTIHNLVVSVPGTGANCSITKSSTNKIVVVVNNSNTNIVINYNVQLQNIRGFHSVVLPKSETISINLGLLTATVFSVTSSSYSFTLTYPDTYITVTIAVSTSSTTFTLLPSSENTPASKTGTKSGSVFSSGNTYYLWGKVIDNRGFSSSYVYLNISETISSNLGLLIATAFSVTSASYSFTLTYPATYTIVTIAVSTSDASFILLTGSEKVISDGSKTGTQSGSVFSSGTPYYLWGKVIDDRGFSSSYVYLNKSQTISIDLGDLNAIEFIVTTTSYKFTLTYTTPYRSVTIAVSTLDSSFNEVTGSTHEITSGGPKAGTQGGSVYTSGTTYYLWGKIVDATGLSNSYVYLDISGSYDSTPRPSNPAITLSKLSQQESHNEINLTIQQNSNSIYTLLHYRLSYTITNVAANLPGAVNIVRSPVIETLDKSTTQIVLPLRQYSFPVIELNDLIEVTVTKIYEGPLPPLPESYLHTVTTTITSSLVSVKQYYVWGYNTDGQVGFYLGNTPVQNYLPVTQKINDIYNAGDLYYKNYTKLKSGNGIQIININGQVWAYGGNNVGQLGIGTFTSNEFIATRIPTLTGDMKILFTGFLTVYAVDVNNNIFVWGYNADGQVGNGNKVNVHTPTQISTSIIARTNKVICIANPFDCSLILTDIGLYVSGANRYGERGDSSSTIYTTFQLVSNDEGFDFRNVIDIKSGLYSTYFLTKDRRVYASGRHSRGQRGTGIGDTDTRTTIPRLVTAFADKQGSIKEIGTSAYALFIIDEHNILWGVGENIPSIPDETHQYNAVKCSNIPVKILYSICFSNVVHFIGMNGKVYYFGRKFSPYILSEASFPRPSDGVYMTWYRDFVDVDTLRDISNRAGVPVEGKVSNIFGTSAVTFYSS
jgi:hypothetical protein